MRESKEQCPLCSRYAMVNVQTKKIRCAPHCEATGLTVSEAKNLKKNVEENPIPFGD